MKRGSILTGGMSIAALVAALSTAPARADNTIVLPRPGQVGVGISGGYGSLLKSGDLGGLFGTGPTLGVRLRYRMRYERAIGLSFESQHFDIRQFEPHFPASDTTLDGRSDMRFTLSGIEFSQLFGTRTRATKMLMVGAGIAQGSGRTTGGDTWFPGDGTYVSAGAGVEYFFFRSWAWDLSTRYMAVFLPTQRVHDVQAALGVMFYASY
ncbi:MAG: outer membrane beta-barrel protein [Candidatus Eisenbacteria bacterium]|uniref:Outer membrane beta-barrel protein n=1 Tax=Eiseniibacteriota bacterium TaxID=2212470 RepID=A0A9D6L8V9_UNCEI|nr:outer membrane beta-barrel protein [Candidatus Eisenbacteria bacterium]MBI3539805.1 outer membrane beta-barrel protein [Candidatus Eisenbacteria bacterium]